MYRTSLTSLSSSASTAGDCVLRIEVLCRKNKFSLIVVKVSLELVLTTHLIRELNKSKHLGVN